MLISVTMLLTDEEKGCLERKLTFPAASNVPSNVPSTAQDATPIGMDPAERECSAVNSEDEDGRHTSCTGEETSGTTTRCRVQGIIRL